jgi:hypothetical protein
MHAAETAHTFNYIMASVADFLDKLHGGSASSYSLPDGADDVVEANFALLGRAIRQKLDGYSFLAKLTFAQISEDVNIQASEWSESVTGVDFKGGIATELWSIIGSGDFMSDLFGRYDATHYRPEDDAIAAMWGLLILLSRRVDPWLITVGDFHNRAVVYDKNNGYGTFTTFSPNKPSTQDSMIFDLKPQTDHAEWQGAYSATYTYLGLSEDDINSQVLRSSDVPILKGSEAYVNKYFSRSKWEYKYMRYVEVIPVYKINMQAIDEIEQIDDETNRYWAIKDGTNNKYRQFVESYKSLLSEVRNSFFQNRFWAKHKQFWEDKRIIDLNIGEGNGGLLHYQNAALYYDYDAGGDTELIGYWWQQTTSNRIALMELKEADEDFYFEIIGGIPMEQYIYLFGEATPEIDFDNDSETGEDAPDTFGKGLLVPAGGLYCFKNLQEAQGEKMFPRNAILVKHRLMSSADDMIAGRVTIKHTSDTQTDPARPTSQARFRSHKLTKNQIIEQSARRVQDPYKRLDFDYHDSRWLDVDNVRTIVANTIFGGLSGGTSSEPITTGEPEPVASATEESTSTPASALGADSADPDKLPDDTEAVASATEPASAVDDTKIPEGKLEVKEGGKTFKNKKGENMEQLKQRAKAEMKKSEKK